MQCLTSSLLQITDQTVSAIRISVFFSSTVLEDNTMNQLFQINSAEDVRDRLCCVLHDDGFYYVGSYLRPDTNLAKSCSHDFRNLLTSVYHRRSLSLVMPLDCLNSSTSTPLIVEDIQCMLDVRDSSNFVIIANIHNHLKGRTPPDDCLRSWHSYSELISRFSLDNTIALNTFDSFFKNCSGQRYDLNDFCLRGFLYEYKKSTSQVGVMCMYHRRLTW